jgi:hypothetical protein
MPYTPGPFNGPHLYLQWGGKLPGGDEWSCGLRMAGIAGLTGPPTNDPTQLTKAAAAVEAWHQNGEISPRAILTFTKLNAIGRDGKYIEQTTMEHVHANVPGTGVDSRTLPNQVALAVSLTTGVSRGPAHRGRFYMPLPTMVVQSNGLISSDDALTVKNAATTFIAALNAMTANYQVAVFSRKAGAPSDRWVTGVEVGRVLDTQRRRRNKLAESYV